VEDQQQLECSLVHQQSQRGAICELLCCLLLQCRIWRPSSASSWVSGAPLSMTYR
jgi:hypothetical protein